MNDIKQHINQWSKFEFTARLMKLREVVSGLSLIRMKALQTLTRTRICFGRTLREIGDNR